MKLFIVLALFATANAYRWDSHGLPGPSSGGSQGEQGGQAGGQAQSFIVHVVSGGGSQAAAPAP